MRVCVDHVVCVCVCRCVVCGSCCVRVCVDHVVCVRV